MLKPPIPLDEENRLAALHGLNILDTPSEERFDRLTRLAQRMLRMPIALVSLIDSNRQWFKSCQGLDARETPRSIAFCGHAILDDNIFIVPDARMDSRFSDNPLVSDAPHIRFYAGQPLKSKNGFRVGTLCVIDSVPRDLTQIEIDSLRDLAALVEEELNSLEMHDLLNEYQHSQSHLEAILSNVLDGIITINESGIIETINKAAEQIFGYAAIEVMGNNVNMLIPQPHKAKHDSYIHNYLATHQPKVIGIGRTVQGMRKNGEIFTMRLSVTEIRRQDGSHFIGLIHDISEEEAALKRADADAKRIDQSSRLIKAIAGSLPGMVAYWGKDLRCRFANHAYMEWFGKAPEAVVGHTIMDLMGESELLHANLTHLLQ